MSFSTLGVLIRQVFSFHFVLLTLSPLYLFSLLYTRYLLHPFQLVYTHETFLSPLLIFLCFISGPDPQHSCHLLSCPVPIYEACTTETHLRMLMDEDIAEVERNHHRHSDKESCWYRSPDCKEFLGQLSEPLYHGLLHTIIVCEHTVFDGSL